MDFILLMLLDLVDPILLFYLLYFYFWGMCCFPFIGLMDYHSQREREKEKFHLLLMGLRFFLVSFFWGFGWIFDSLHGFPFFLLQYIYLIYLLIRIISFLCGTRRKKGKAKDLGRLR